MNLTRLEFNRGIINKILIMIEEQSFFFFFFFFFLVIEYKTNNSGNCDVSGDLVLTTDTLYIHHEIISVHQWSERPGFYPRSSHTKDFKNGT